MNYTPAIVVPAPQLTWSHYEILISLKKVKIKYSAFDLGFRIYPDILGANTRNLTENTIVTVKKKNNNYSFALHSNITPGQLYTYKGYITEIIDGDTLWVNLDLGCNTWTNRKLRLKGINTPAYAMPWENYREICLCRGLKKPFKQFIESIKIMF